MTERGHAAVEFALTVAILLIPVVVVVTAFGPWSERRVLANAMAAEAARVAVIELDESAGSDLVVNVAASAGLELDLVRLGWCGGSLGSPDDVQSGCDMGRGSVVTARVDVWAPLVRTPWGDVGGLWVSVDHSEPVDLYRSLP